MEKLCFFTIHCNPSLAYISVRDLLSSQRYASVKSVLLAGNFLYRAAECWRGRGGKLSRILEKNKIFNEHPVAPRFKAGGETKGNGDSSSHQAIQLFSHLSFSYV